MLLLAIYEQCSPSYRNQSVHFYCKSIDWFLYDGEHWSLMGERWLSLTFFKSILKILYSNYLSFCSNLPVKVAIFLKSSLLFTSFYCLFCLQNKALRINNLKTRTAMNLKISVLVISIEAILHLLLYNLHDCVFNTALNTLYLLAHFRLMLSIYTTDVF